MTYKLAISALVGFVAMAASFALFDPQHGYLQKSIETTIARRSVDLVDCSRHGIYNGTDCVCFSGYTTFPSGNVQQCAYPVKDRTTAFIFSILFCYIGLDQFYLGNYALGACKLVFGGLLTGF